VVLLYKNYYLNKKEQKISAFMNLLKPVQARITAYCRVLSGNGEAASDLLQDTLLAAFETFENLRIQDSFLYFLFSIARNKYLKQKRRWKFWGREQEAHQLYNEVSSQTIELQPDIELLYKSIAKLNNEQRDIVIMFHILGFSINEIQQHKGLTEAAVKNRLQRARAKLKQLLSDSENNISIHYTKIKQQ
jgi:RNA polymerase sigma factor (sigma-70 family)